VGVWEEDVAGPGQDSALESLEQQAPTYLSVVNADPVTGVPAVLGELAQDLRALDAFGSCWAQPEVTSIDQLAIEKPELYRKLLDLVEGSRTPTRSWLILRDQELQLLDCKPLALAPTSALRYFHTLWQTERITSDDFLRSIPPEIMVRQGTRLSEQGNEHLVFFARGTPVSGRVSKGILLAGAAALSGVDCGGDYIALVDRIDAHHTALLGEQRCRGVLALRGSPADHFALMARERDFSYMILDVQSVDREWPSPICATLPYGELVTVDFANGAVYLGDGSLDTDPRVSQLTALLGLLRQKQSPVAIRMNIDSPGDINDDCLTTIIGIGLLRTEHMLQVSGMQAALRRFMESSSAETQETSLTELATFFHREFVRCLILAAGLPVAIRLLDYPLHELGTVFREVNPMLGLRGVRQGLRWPQLYNVQIEAILGAAADVRREGVPVHCVEIMLPLVNLVEEVCLIRKWVDEHRDARPEERDLPIKLGVMIETPAACLVIEELASACDFLSFGTNDLVQLTMGLSREDYSTVLRVYQSYGLMRHDPFEQLPPAVFQMVRDAALRAKRARPSIVIGVCGAQAAHPQMLELCDSGLVDYLSVPRGLLLQVKLQALQALRPEQDHEDER
jgi:pyruvate,orthophosphate dikinase